MEKTFQINNLQPNSSHSVRVRAVFSDGTTSEWSQLYKFTVKGDDTPPSQPAAPTIFVADLQSSPNEAMGPQTIRFRHDSSKNGGGDLEFDIDYFEVYVNNTNSNSGGTQIGTVKATRPGLGAYAEATLPVNSPDSSARYFYVIAVDRSGLRSSASPTATATAIPTFSNAYISDLSADKITTGTLQAGQQITVGDSVAILLRSNSISPKAEFLSFGGSTPGIGAGYNNNSVGFYMDSTGRFSLKQALTFDPDANSGNGLLTINADGAFSGNLSAGISITSPVITGGSITGTTLNIGNGNFQVDSSGNMESTGSTLTGGSITAALFKTSAVTGVNRIEIDGQSSKDTIKFLNLGDGFYNLQISGANLVLNNNYPGSITTGWPNVPEFRIFNTNLVVTNTLKPLDLYRQTSTSTDAISQFRSNVGGTNTPVLNILANGNYQQLSDISIKENILSARNYLSDINKIEIVTFNYIGSEDKQLGVIAQQISEIFPSMVSDMGNGKLGVKYEVFVPMLITAVQELSSRVQYLEGLMEVDGGN